MLHNCIFVYLLEALYCNFLGSYGSDSFSVLNYNLRVTTLTSSTPVTKTKKNRKLFPVKEIIYPYFTATSLVQKDN